MMQKNIFLIIIFLIIIAFPFVFGEDLDGDGVDDGEQNLCGDGSCQDWEENEVTCPEDCLVGGLKYDYMDKFIPSTKKTDNKGDFFSNKIFIISVISIILIVGIVFLVIFLLKKKGKGLSKKSTSAKSDASAGYSSSV